MADYDAIIIGGGPAGEHCAGALADGGARVALVERELVAGECSYWACIPSKTLLRPGEAIAAARRAPGAREALAAGVDVTAALAWRDFMVSDYDDAGQVAWLEGKGIDLIRGSARIAGPGRVAIGARELTCRHIVVATGSEPVIPPVSGLAGMEGVWTNRAVTALTEVPRRLLVLGGGPVGVEMSQALARMGSSVALVEGGGHVLPREPEALGRALGRALAADGVEVHLGRHATRAWRDDGGFEIELTDGTRLGGDRLLVATGRRPRVEGLGLDSVGIEPGPRGVPVDDHMAAADGVWAIGDVTGIWPLTYVGKYQARVAAANILGEEAAARYDAVPRVVFTDPQAASVGLADDAVSVTVDLAGVPRTATYTRDYEDAGFLTIVSDGRRLTGAYALGPEAGEWLQQATLAIRAELPLELLWDTIQPFPTFSEAFLPALAELRARLRAPVA